MQDKSYYEGLRKIIMKQFEGDATWSDVVNYREQCGVKTTYDYVQRGSAILMELLRAGYTLVPPNENAATQERQNDFEQNVIYNADGSYTYSKLISISKEENLTPERVMELHGIDPEKWICTGYRNNFWSNGGVDQNGNAVACYQSKVVVKPKTKSTITFEDIDEYFAKGTWQTRKPVKPIEVDDSDEILEIAYADNHLGLLSWSNEVGNDYDIHIAAERMRTTFADILGRCKGKKYKLINFVTLGDILHIDNMASTTTKGTPQDSDGRITKIFDIAVDLMCDLLDMLLQLNCPVRYTYTAGNHDAFSGYALAKTLQKVYEKDQRVTFDISPNPHKATVYGVTLVGFTHGDMNKKNLGEWLQRTFRREYGEAKFAEVHCGHLHSESVTSNCGVMIKRLPTLCESSLWEHKEGYDSQKGVMCFVYNEKLGLRDTWHSYL